MRPNSACPDPAPGLKKLSNPPKGLFWGDPHVPRPECTIVDGGASSLARGMVGLVACRAWKESMGVCVMLFLLLLLSLSGWLTRSCSRFLAVELRKAKSTPIAFGVSLWRRRCSPPVKTWSCCYQSRRCTCTEFVEEKRLCHLVDCTLVRRHLGAHGPRGIRSPHRGLVLYCTWETTSNPSHPIASRHCFISSPSTAWSWYRLVLYSSVLQSCSMRGIPPARSSPTTPLKSRGSQHGQDAVRR
jgi:hypothetical protein